MTKPRVFKESAKWVIEFESIPGWPQYVSEPSWDDAIRVAIGVMRAQIRRLNNPTQAVSQ